MDQAIKDKFRYFLKDTVRQTIDFSTTDQNRGIDPPPIEKLIPEGTQRIDLIPAARLRDISDMDVFTSIANRRNNIF